MSIASPGFHPGGMAENSPTFQGWVCRSNGVSSEGTADSHLRQAPIFLSAVPSGLEIILRANLMLNPWPIVEYPSGTGGGKPGGLMRPNSTCA
jgi:hypothetical protein